MAHLRVHLAKLLLQSLLVPRRIPLLCDSKHRLRLGFLELLELLVQADVLKADIKLLVEEIFDGVPSTVITTNLLVVELRLELVQRDRDFDTLFLGHDQVALLVILGL